MVNIEVIFQQLIDFSLKNNCSDLHLNLDNKKCCHISVRWQGKIINIKKLNKNTSHKLINYILFIGKFDIIDNQALHTNTIKYFYAKREYFLRVSIVFTHLNKSIVIRIVNNHKIIGLSNLTVSKDNYYQLQQILNYKNGLVIFTGKTGAGKTTTLYALLNEFKKNNEINIISLEDPIEKEIDGVFQINVNSEIYSYFDVLKQVLRHDPDIIIVGEIRDEKDLKLVVQAALSGHLVITSMHAISALFAVNRLLELKISISDLKACLRLIVYQELFYTNDRAYSLYEFINQDNLYEYLESQKTTYTTIDKHKEEIQDD